MQVTYSARKDLPCDQLCALFAAVGWSDGAETTAAMVESFNKPFLHSTVVVSAWDGERLAGCVRVISDGMFRSVIYDLAVLPEYQGRGIGGELVKRCREYFPNSEWLVGTTPERAGFYENLGFQTDKGVFLSIPCKWFS